MECGVGVGLAYFMDNCEKVISIEYVTPGYSDKQYQEAVRLFSDRTNWMPMTYNADYRSNSFNNATAYQCSTQKDYATIDASYLRELYQHFKTQKKMPMIMALGLHCQKVRVAFSGLHCGEIFLILES